MTVLITGSSGFIGKNLINYFQQFKINIKITNRRELNEINSRLFNGTVNIIHLAGKAHDLKNTSKPDEYYHVNTKLTKNIFDAFLTSQASVFITLSSVKAVTDQVDGFLTEGHVPNPTTYYGKSKLLSEQYILSKEIPEGKRIYILRPCMIHGPGNKGNLNLLYNLVSKGLPWPLGSFENSRSFLSIDNLCFVIKELIERQDIPSGVYNIADDGTISTKELIKLIAKSNGKKAVILNINKSLIKKIAYLGDILKLPLNSERLQKLTASYIVSNTKIKSALGKPLPVTLKEGLIKTFQSFAENA